MDNDNLLITHLSKKSIIVLSAKIVNFIAVFASVILLARFFSQTLFGRYQQCWLIINTVVPVLILGAPQGLSFFLPRADNNKYRALLCWRFYLLIITAGLMFLLVVIIFPGIFGRLLGNDQITSLEIPLTLLIFFLLPSYCLEALLVINNRPFLLLVVNILYAFVFLALHVLCATYSLLTELFWFLSLLALGKTVFTLWYTRNVYAFPFKVREIFNFHALRILVGYLLTLSIIALLDVLTVQIDKYLVVWFYKGQETIFAVYSVGAMEIPLVALILGAISSVVMPEFSRLFSQRDIPQALSLLRIMTYRLNLMLFPLFIFLLCSGFVLVPFFFGVQYRPSIGIFIVYLFLIPNRIIANHPLLIAGGLQRFALYGRIIDLVVNVTLGLLLLPVLGYYGPAISTITATYFHKMYQIGVIQKFLGVSWTRLYPWRRMGMFAGLCSVCAVLEVLIVNLLVHPPLVSLLISGVLYGITMVLLCRKFYAAE